MKNIDNRKKPLTTELLAECKKLKNIFDSKKKELKISQSSIADEMGVNQSSVSHYLNGINALNAPAATVFARILKVKVSDFSPRLAKELNSLTKLIDPSDSEGLTAKTDHIEIIGGIDAWDDNTPLNDDEVEIPLIKEIELRAGNGSIPISEYKTKAKLRFGKSTLTKQGVDFSKSVCVIVSGNSMEPFIPDGATVGIDTNNTSIVDGKIYAVAIDDDLVRLKLLYKLPGNKVRLRSFNRDEYEDEDYSLEEIWVIGKMFWSSVLWN